MSGPVYFSVNPTSGSIEYGFSCYLRLRLKYHCPAASGLGIVQQSSALRSAAAATRPFDHTGLALPTNCNTLPPYPRIPTPHLYHRKCGLAPHPPCSAAAPQGGGVILPILGYRGVGYWGIGGRVGNHMYMSFSRFSYTLSASWLSSRA